MPVAPSIRSHLDDHLGQAEFALKVAANFDCLQGTPAHDDVRAALAKVADARSWVRQNLAEKSFLAGPAKSAGFTPAEQHRVIQRRMARLAP